MKKLLYWMIGLSVLGFVLSLYAFLHNRGFAPGSICTINATINCDVVNKGPFSLFFGIPVALIGCIGYFFLCVGSLAKLQNSEDKLLTLFLFGLSYLGFGFSLYLTSLEAFVLHAWCLICVTSQLAMLAFLVLTTILAYQEEKMNPIQAWLRRHVLRR